MAKVLGILVVVEGVEQEEVKILTALDCDFTQGYYFSKPPPAEEQANY